MKHLDEAQLTLHYYGDDSDPALTRRHLSSCQACATSYAAIKDLLDDVSLEVPERDAAYEERVWRRLQADLAANTTRKPHFAWLGVQGLRATMALAAVFAAAFFLGHYLGRGDQSQKAADHELVAQEAGQRVLQLAMNRHLEQSSFFLRDLVNASSDYDPQMVRRSARELVATNRLYRNAARLKGERQLVLFLEELEMALLELANDDGSVSNLEIETVRRQDHTELLFKIKVFNQSQTTAKPTKAVATQI